MEPSKHMKGLQQGLDEQIKETKRMGGASDALKAKKKRPESKTWRLKAVLGITDAYGDGWEVIFGKKEKGKQ